MLPNSVGIVCTLAALLSTSFGQVRQSAQLSADQAEDGFLPIFNGVQYRNIVLIPILSGSAQPAKPAMAGCSQDYSVNL